MGPARDRRLRIAFVYDALVPFCSGGAERRYHELATRLARQHEVHYVTWRWWGPEPAIVRDGVTYHGIGAPRDFYGPDGRRTVGEMVAFALKVPRALAKLDVDVVDVSATPYLPVYATWLATRLTRTPLVATWHEFWGEHWHTYLADRPILARLARLAESAARRFADRSVAVSAFTARRLGPLQRLRRLADVVPNGVDLERPAITSGGRRSDVVFVGRLIAEKRVDLLVRAMAELAPRRPRIRCLIIGDGPERESLRELADSLGVARNVQFLGRVPDGELPGLLAMSRILVLPSAREGYGIAVVEGQAAGLVPIVARSPFSAAVDLVTDGVDGLVVDPTALGISGAIDGVLADRGRLRRMATGARASAATRGWDDRAADMERIYLAAASANRRALPFRHARAAGDAVGGTRT